MIIEVIKKIINFLKNRPASTLSYGLDCTKEFTLKQIDVAYIVTMIIMSTSMLALILPYPGQKSQKLHKSYRLVQEEALSLDAKTKKPVSSAFRLIPQASKKVANLAPHLAPTPGNIKQKFPLTLVWRYSLSHPSELDFFVVLKPVNTHLQILLKETVHAKNRNLSSGFYFEGMKIIDPAIPLIKNELSQAKRSLLVSFGNFSRQINHLFDDTLTSADESIDVSATPIISAEANQIPEDDSVNLVRADSRYPGRNTGTESSNTRSRRERSLSGSSHNVNRGIGIGTTSRAFIKHLSKSIYYRIDLLSTFVLRIEP